MALAGSFAAPVPEDEEKVPAAEILEYEYNHLPDGGYEFK